MKHKKSEILHQSLKINKQGHNSRYNAPRKQGGGRKGTIASTKSFSSLPKRLSSLKLIKVNQARKIENSRKMNFKLFKGNLKHFMFVDGPGETPTTRKPAVFRDEKVTYLIENLGSDMGSRQSRRVKEHRQSIKKMFTRPELGRKANFRQNSLTRFEGLKAELRMNGGLRRSRVSTQALSSIHRDGSVGFNAQNVQKSGQNLRFFQSEIGQFRGDIQLGISSIRPQTSAMAIPHYSNSFKQPYKNKKNQFFDQKSKQTEKQLERLQRVERPQNTQKSSNLGQNHSRGALSSEKSQKSKITLPKNYQFKISVGENEGYQSTDSYPSEDFTQVSGNRIVSKLEYSFIKKKRLNFEDVRFQGGKISYKAPQTAPIDPLDGSLGSRKPKKSQNGQKVDKTKSLLNSLVSNSIDRREPKNQRYYARYQKELAEDVKNMNFGKQSTFGYSSYYSRKYEHAFPVGATDGASKTQEQRFQELYGGKGVSSAERRKWIYNLMEDVRRHTEQRKRFQTAQREALKLRNEQEKTYLSGSQFAQFNRFLRFQNKNGSRILLAGHNKEPSVSCNQELVEESAKNRRLGSMDRKRTSKLKRIKRRRNLARSGSKELSRSRGEHQKSQNKPKKGKKVIKVMGDFLDITSDSDSDPGQTNTTKGRIEASQDSAMLPSPSKISKNAKIVPDFVIRNNASNTTKQAVSVSTFKINQSPAQITADMVPPGLRNSQFSISKIQKKFKKKIFVRVENPESTSKKIRGYRRYHNLFLLFNGLVILDEIPEIHKNSSFVNPGGREAIGGVSGGPGGGGAPLEDRVWVAGDELHSKFTYCLGQGNNIKLIKKSVQKRKLVEASTLWNRAYFAWSQNSRRTTKISKIYDFLSLRLKFENLENQFLRTSQKFRDALKAKNVEAVHQTSQIRKKNQKNSKQKEEKIEKNFSRLFQNLFKTGSLVVLRTLLMDQKLAEIDPRFVDEVLDHFREEEAVKAIEYRKLKMVNHFKGMKHVGKKHLLAKSIKGYCERYGLDELEFIPRTFVVDSEEDLDAILGGFVEADSEGEEEAEEAGDDKIGSKSGNSEENLESEKNEKVEKKNENVVEGDVGDDCESAKLWIIKPGECSNRGKGISMARTLKKAKKVTRNILKKRKANYVIVQEYIQNPLLFKGRKFDLRCYALVTKFGSKFSVYWYKKGYARTSSYDFDLGNIDNLMIHLTNEAVQVKSKLPT